MIGCVLYGFGPRTGTKTGTKFSRENPVISVSPKIDRKKTGTWDFLPPSLDAGEKKRAPTKGLSRVDIIITYDKFDLEISFSWFLGNPNQGGFCWSSQTHKDSWAIYGYCTTSNCGTIRSFSTSS